MLSAILRMLSFRTTGSFLKQEQYSYQVILATLRLTEAATGCVLKIFAKFTGK